MDSGWQMADGRWRADTDYLREVPSWEAWEACWGMNGLGGWRRA